MRLQILLVMSLLPQFAACTSAVSNPERVVKEQVGPIAGTWHNQSGDARVTIAPTASAGFTVETPDLYVHINKQGYETKTAPLVIPGAPPTDWTAGDKREWDQVLSTYLRYIDDTQHVVSKVRETLESFDQPEVKALIPPLKAMEKALSSNQGAKVTAALRKLAKVMTLPRLQGKDSNSAPMINNLSPELPDAPIEDALQAH